MQFYCTNPYCTYMYCTYCTYLYTLINQYSTDPYCTCFYCSYCTKLMHGLQYKSHMLIWLCLSQPQFEVFLQCWETCAVPHWQGKLFHVFVPCTDSTFRENAVRLSGSSQSLLTVAQVTHWRISTWWTYLLVDGPAHVPLYSVYTSVLMTF